MLGIRAAKMQQTFVERRRNRARPDHCIIVTFRGKSRLAKVGDALPSLRRVFTRQGSQVQTIAWGLRFGFGLDTQTVAGTTPGYAFFPSNSPTIERQEPKFRPRDEPQRASLLLVYGLGFRRVLTRGS